MSLKFGRNLCLYWNKWYLRRNLDLNSTHCTAVILALKVNTYNKSRLIFFDFQFFTKQFYFHFFEKWKYWPDIRFRPEKPQSHGFLIMFTQKIVLRLVRTGIRVWMSRLRSFNVNWTKSDTTGLNPNIRVMWGFDISSERKMKMTIMPNPSVGSIFFYLVQ